MNRIVVVSLVLALITAVPAQGFVVNGVCAPSPVIVGVNADGEFNLAKSADIGWVRVNLRWRQINPANGVWDFTVSDAIINGAEAQGLKILGILSTAPAWAGGGINGNTPPSNTNLWKEYVKRVAQRYADRVAAYEIWNEPNLENNGGIGIGWDKAISSSPTYSDYLRIAALEIRAWAPGTLVVAPGTSSSPNSRTVQIFQQIQNTGSSGYLDVISFHANGNNKSVAEVQNQIQSHLNTIANNNASNFGKPIWITEMGWRSGAVGEAGQRDRIISILSGMSGSGTGSDPLFCQGWETRDFTHAFVFLLKDLPTESAGIHRLDSSRKPFVTDYLLPKPFPAVHENPYYSVPFSTSCVGRACTFTSSFTDPGSLYDFHWSVGDGSAATVGGHQKSRTYAKKGWYQVEMALLLKGSTLGGGGYQRWIWVP